MPATSVSPRVDPPPARRDATHLILIALSLAAVAAALWLVADAIVIAFGGIVLATVLLSISTPLAGITGLKPRWSLLIVVLALVGMAALLSWLFGNEFAAEVAELQQRLPAAGTEFVAWLNQSPLGRVIVNAILESGANMEALGEASGP